MSIFYLLEWWYGRGFMRQWQLVGLRTAKIGQAFSGGTLIRTLFSPWKQLVSPITKPGPSLQKLADNLVSRFVGFFIRFFTLLAAIVSLVVVGMLSILWAVLWPLVPFMSIAAILKGIGII